MHATKKLEPTRENFGEIPFGPLIFGEQTELVCGVGKQILDAKLEHLGRRNSNRLPPARGAESEAQALVPNHVVLRQPGIVGRQPGQRSAEQPRRHRKVQRRMSGMEEEDKIGTVRVGT